MHRFVFFLAFTALSVVYVYAQTNGIEDARKTLREIESRIDSGTATDGDLQAIRNLYESNSDEPVRLVSLQLAAKYRRLILKNPVQSLEIVLPHLIGKERTTAWIKAIPPSGRNNVQVAGIPDLPPVDVWMIDAKTAHLALEAAHSLSRLGRPALALDLANEVGKQFSDEARVLAAECIADVYLASGRIDKSHEFYRFSLELLDRIKRGDYFAERTERRLARTDRELIARRIRPKFDMIVRLIEDERFGTDWTLYRDARQFHVNDDLVDAYLIYMELIRDHSETIFAEAARCHAIEILAFRASKDSAQKKEPIITQWQDGIAKTENALRLETSRGGSESVLGHYRTRIASFKRKLGDIARIPEGPAALDLAERETEKFIERNPKGPYRGEAMLHVGLARLKINLDADKAEYWLRRAEGWLHEIGSRSVSAMNVPGKAQNAAKLAADLRPGQQKPFSYAELQSPEHISELHQSTLLWLGVLSFSKRDYTQASTHWKKRNELSEDSTDSLSRHLTEKTVQGVDSPLARSSEALAARNSRLHLAMHVADLHLALGDTAESERLFRSVLNTKPGSADRHTAAYCIFALAECGLKREGVTKKNLDMLLEFAPGKKYADTHVTKTALFRLADCLPSDHPMKEKVTKHVAQKYPEGNHLK